MQIVCLGELVCNALLLFFSDHRLSCPQIGDTFQQCIALIPVTHRFIRDNAKLFCRARRFSSHIFNLPQRRMTKNILSVSAPFTSLARTERKVTDVFELQNYHWYPRAARRQQLLIAKVRNDSNLCNRTYATDVNLKVRHDIEVILRTHLCSPLRQFQTTSLTHRS